MEEDSDSANDGSDRIACDPCVSAGDLEAVFMAWFALGVRDLTGLMLLFAAETWQTAAKAVP